MANAWPWSKMNIVPTDSLAAWWHDDGDRAADGLMPNVLGDPDLVATSPKPMCLDALSEINGQAAWWFDGNSNPLTASIEMTMRHAFIIASFNDIEASDPQTLLTSDAGSPSLYTQTAGRSFVCTEADIVRVDGIRYGPAEQLADLHGPFRLIEAVFADGVEISDVQIGVGLEGHVCEALLYSRVLDDRLLLPMLRRYIAMRYHIWEKAL
jgi:hypothetical protein